MFTNNYYLILFMLVIIDMVVVWKFGLGVEFVDMKKNTVKNKLIVHIVIIFIISIAIGLFAGLFENLNNRNKYENHVNVYLQERGFEVLYIEAKANSDIFYKTGPAYFAKGTIREDETVYSFECFSDDVYLEKELQQKPLCSWIKRES